MMACTVCGRVGAWEQHHPTGRDQRDRYLDPTLTMPLCHDHHTLVHDDLHTLGLSHADERPTLIESIVVCLRRLAAVLARVDATRPVVTFWGLLADAMTGWADALTSTVECWDARDPRWRQDARCYAEPGA